MSNMTATCRWVGLLLILTALGCSGDAGPKLAPVKGKVTAGGSSPFKNGLVRFVPKDTKLNMREATTDAQGNYVIQFNNSRSGLQPGAYTVHFSLFQMPDGSSLPDQSKSPDPRSPAELGAVEWVPADYATGKAEKCSVTVSDKGGEFNFDLPELKAQVVKK